MFCTNNLHQRTTIIREILLDESFSGNIPSRLFKEMNHTALIEEWKLNLDVAAYEKNEC